MIAKPLFVVAGKRKTAVAKAFVFSGKGHVTYNGQHYEALPFFHKLAISEPLKIAQETLGALSFDIKIRTSGGGKEGQIQAARLALAKALVRASQSLDLRKAYLKYDRALLVADTRRKEPYKPGDSKARAKRQKSYR
ncbi:MAG: 30S ribosomal protein S9 [Nanoarchaeota archaeon]